MKDTETVSNARWPFEMEHHDVPRHYLQFSDLTHEEYRHLFERSKT